MNKESIAPKETGSTDSRALLDHLRALAQASESLRLALTKRDIETIFALTSMQEDLARWFHTQADARALQNMARSPVEQKEISILAAAIQRTQRTNKALANSFLSLINRTISRVIRSGLPGECLYGSSGSLDAAISPLLIRRKG